MRLCVSCAATWGSGVIWASGVVLARWRRGEETGWRPWRVMGRAAYTARQLLTKQAQCRGEAAHLSWGGWRTPISSWVAAGWAGLGLVEMGNATSGSERIVCAMGVVCGKRREEQTEVGRKNEYTYYG